MGIALLLSGCELFSRISTKACEGTLQSFEYNYGSFFDEYWNFQIVLIGTEAADGDAAVYQFIAKGHNRADADVEAYLTQSEVDQLIKILRDYDVYAWNGFSKIDKNILDGFSFSLEARFSDGSLKASGYMKYPKNFKEGHAALAEYLVSLAKKYDSQTVFLSPSLIGALPDKEALSTICDLLGKSWRVTPDQYPNSALLANFFNREGAPSFGYGLYATSFGRHGEIIDSYATGAYEMTLIIYIPARPPGEIDDGYPESIQTVYVDVSRFSESGQIRIKIEGFAGGEWYTYTQTQS